MILPILGIVRMLHHKTLSFFILNFYLTFGYYMPSQRLRKSISLPLLQIKRLQRRLLFTHLAPIPEVPLRMPDHPDPKRIDQLLEWIDFCIEDSKIKTQTWPGFTSVVKFLKQEVIDCMFASILWSHKLWLTIIYLKIFAALIFTILSLKSPHYYFLFQVSNLNHYYLINHDLHNLISYRTFPYFSATTVLGGEPMAQWCAIGWRSPRFGG